MLLSTTASSASCRANFSRAVRHASALPRRARVTSARSSGRRIRRALIAAICASRSAGGGTCACNSASFFKSSRSAASLSWSRRSTPDSSRSQRSAAALASFRRSRIGFFSSSSLASASFCSFAFCARCSSIFRMLSSICAMRSATSFCSCSSFFSATISLRTSGKLTACEQPSRPRLTSLFCRTRFSWRKAIRVFCRRIFSPISRRPVRMKLTG